MGRDPTRKSPYGCLDMGESVGEWCENWYHEFLDEIITLHNGSLEAVLADTEGVAYKDVRGGGYFDKGQPSCKVRGYNPAGFKHGFIGFSPALCSP